jgi:hypothetical protein
MRDRNGGYRPFRAAIRTYNGGFVVSGPANSSDWVATVAEFVLRSPANAARRRRRWRLLSLKSRHSCDKRRHAPLHDRSSPSPRDAASPQGQPKGPRKGSGDVPSHGATLEWGRALPDQPPGSHARAPRLPGGCEARGTASRRRSDDPRSPWASCPAGTASTSRAAPRARGPASTSAPSRGIRRRQHRMRGCGDDGSHARPDSSCPPRGVRSHGGDRTGRRRGGGGARREARTG